MMVSLTNEQALEAIIQKVLTGTNLEELKQEGITTGVAEAAEPYRAGNGYYVGEPGHYNPKYAVDEHRLWHFLQNTQAEALAKLQRHDDWKLKILERLDRMIKKHGVLHVLRKGLDIDDIKLTFFYQAPLAASSQRVKDMFESNEFSATRQLAYSLDNPREEIDMVLFVNGLPIVTLELKNQWTGQNAKVHGQKQYKYDRDIKQPLLNFARCLVHITLDTDEAYMTTRLDGGKTNFLPFNKGHNNGKGNPPNPTGHKTAYIWEEVFTRPSLANLIQHFVWVAGEKTTDPLSKQTLFFPRYHQMDVVRKLVKHASEYGTDQTYLIQHSAGSGKSNSITWAAYQLIEATPANTKVAGDRGMEYPVFDSVIVVTDRRLLDKQIKKNIQSFSEVKNIVAHANSSSDLKEALETGKKIIISTIQKFPFIVDGISDLSQKKFAVIIDEAHSSQSGTAAGKMNQAIGQSVDDEEPEDTQDLVLKAIQARKMRGNASYFAFTATPKNSTLERFGEKQEDGKFKPFHLYSMKQAIEEGFILDVLANYTTYRSYYEIQKSIEDNPEFNTKEAQKRLKGFVEKHPETIATKAEIILDHFITKVYNTKKLRGKAKAIVATQSIETAIRYYQSLKRLLSEKGDPFEILVAFSGTKVVDGIEYTEAELNGFSEADTRDKFDEDKYRILVVANKYLTGFDQPKLTAMYVDKKLQGVLAVQALSRLNRANNKLGKKTEDLFILDFFNSTEDIKLAFDDFYTSTTLNQATDVNVLHELKETLGDVGVYEWDEVEEFARQYFNSAPSDQLSPLVDIPAGRFNDELDLTDEEKADFKIKAKQFVKIYGQMASIIDFEVVSWEELFWFLKFLIPKLIVKDKDKDAIDDLLDSVDLSTYGLERVRLNYSIGLDDTETELDPQNPNPRGAHGGEEKKDPLMEIIKNFNERFYQGWEATPEDQKIKIVSLGKHIQDHPDFQTKVAKNKDNQNREIALKKILDDVMDKQKRNELDLYKLYAKDEAFYKAFYDTMKRVVFSDFK